jgi:hypothetical protein
VWGIRGSAAATVLCELAAAIFIAWLAAAQLEIRPRTPIVLLRPVAAAAVACGVLYPVYARPELSAVDGLVLLPVAVVLFTGTVAVLGGLPDHVTDVARRIVGRRRVD